MCYVDKQHRKFSKCQLTAEFAIGGLNFEILYLLACHIDDQHRKFFKFWLTAEFAIGGLTFENFYLYACQIDEQHRGERAKPIECVCV